MNIMELLNVTRRTGMRTMARGTSVGAGLFSRNAVSRGAAASFLGSGLGRLGRPAMYGALAGAGLGVAGRMGLNAYNGDPLMSGTFGMGLRGAAGGAAAGAFGYGAYRMGQRNAPELFKRFRATRPFSTPRTFARSFSSMREEPI